MKRLFLVVALVSISAPAPAQSFCRVYEYAELRDWSADQLKQTRCAYYKSMTDLIELALIEIKAGRSGSSQAAQNDAHRCTQEMDRMEKILLSKYNQQPQKCLTK